MTILAHDASSNIVGCGTKLGRVTIGDNVFVGTNSTILCNTHIGNNVVIGAGSVVSGDLPSNAVYAGVPAVKICSIEDYYRKNLRLKEERPSFDQIRRWDTWREAPSEEKEYMKKALEVYMSININIRELSQEAQNHFKMLEQDVEFME